MYLKPFNLERALAGDPVVTRLNQAVSEIVLLKTAKKPVISVVGAEVRNHYLNGARYGDQTSNVDLFMVPIKTPYFQIIYRSNKIVFSGKLNKGKPPKDEIKHRLEHSGFELLHIIEFEVEE